MILTIWEYILTKFIHLEKTSGYGLINFCPVMICVLLVQHGYCSQCSSPDCHSGYSPSEMPNPSTESGLCGRFCSSTFICDPCQILNNSSGKQDNHRIESGPPS